MDRRSAGRSSVGRSSLARASLARLARPLLAAAPAGVGRVPARRAARGFGGRRGTRSGRPHASLPIARRSLRALWRHRRLRIVLLACLVALPLLAGGWRWLRHSSFVSVQSVRVSGVHGPEAQAIESALTRSARHMSTLDVNLRALRAAVAPFALVREVRATASFPHGLNIRVIEQPPVAALVVGSTRTAVAATGVVLGQALLSSSLPTVAGSSAPATGARVRETGLLEGLAALGAAPGPLAKVVARVFAGPEGLTVAFRNGLLAYFGDATRPHAKWLSLARVLADSGSTGASYVDVRVPEHPAAGFPSGTPPAAANGSGVSSEAGASGSPSGSEEAIAAIAARLVGPKGSESASNPAEAANSPASESQTPSGATEAGAATTPETTRAPAEEPQANGATSATKGH
jgi:cell division septal protein FtsQ